MTPTFIADGTEHARQIVPVADGPDAVPDGKTSSAQAEVLPPRRGFMRRAVAALFSPLRNWRRLQPPRDDYLKRDIGLEEREMPREYWEYWWYR